MSYLIGCPSGLHMNDGRCGCGQPGDIEICPRNGRPLGDCEEAELCPKCDGTTAVKPKEKP